MRFISISIAVKNQLDEKNLEEKRKTHRKKTIFSFVQNLSLLRSKKRRNILKENV